MVDVGHHLFVVNLFLSISTLFCVANPHHHHPVQLVPELLKASTDLLRLVEPKPTHSSSDGVGGIENLIEKAVESAVKVGAKQCDLYAVFQLLLGESSPFRRAFFVALLELEKEVDAWRGSNQGHAMIRPRGEAIHWLNGLFSIVASLRNVLTLKTEPREIVVGEMLPVLAVLNRQQRDAVFDVLSRINLQANLHGEHVIVAFRRAGVQFCTHIEHAINAQRNAAATQIAGLCKKFGENAATDSHAEKQQTQADFEKSANMTHDSFVLEKLKRETTKGGPLSLLNSLIAFLRSNPYAMVFNEVPYIFAPNGEQTTNETPVLLRFRIPMHSFEHIQDQLRKELVAGLDALLTEQK